ncbi:helix-turn-helix domain-containing protein [Kutzneria buriramensis]|uniref:PucR-like helix-turn-helix protein n=1 Tax=Kutzneria buriramensis TaxID=1045776 RepID=A0A3E0HGP4_9PSEU|nr:helix-turn-helix domain-containing protein [Kutzneria buriramensis]REH44909.1 PucR-like helix-turn-helix protein [Kutzneria buriramensis]
MKGLLLRLSALDSDAASAVRVISFFDVLVAQHAGLERLVASTAQLAECPAGLSVPETGVWLRADAAGVSLAEAPPPAVSRELDGGGRVWLERAGEPLPLDEIVLERFAIAASVLLNETRARLSGLDDPALLELAVSASAGDAERSRALHLLGFSPLTPIRVLATPHALPDPPGPQAAIGSQHAVLAPAETIVPTGHTIGVGPMVPAMRAPESWRAATVAVRFAAPGVIDTVEWDSLGALGPIAQRLPADGVGDVPDLAALDRLAAEPGGQDTLDLLTAVVATDSVRKAAALVHRHHSSVAGRLARAEATLGFDVHSPGGRFRLTLALALRRLRDS